MKRFFAAALLMGLTFASVSAKSMMRHHMEEMAPMSSVNSVLQSMTGTWTGQGTMVDMMTHKPMNMTDHLTSSVALNNKFIECEMQSNPGPTGMVFKGTGFTGYDSTTGKYHMYWFDSMGFGGEFVGTKQGNTITYTHPERHGRMMTLTATIVSPDEHRMVLWEGKGTKQMKIMDVTYTRTGAGQMQGGQMNTNTNQQQTKPTGY